MERSSTDDYPKPPYKPALLTAAATWLLSSGWYLYTTPSTPSTAPGALGLVGDFWQVVFHVTYAAIGSTLTAAAAGSLAFLLLAVGRHRRRRPRH